MRVSDVLARFPEPNRFPLPAPFFSPRTGETDLPRIALGVESMSRHMTNEGWEIMLGLRAGGYEIAGKDCDINLTDVRKILEDYNPGTVVVQDKREWMGLTADKSRDPSMRFTGIEELRNRLDIFKLTIVKDAQHDNSFHSESAEEIGCHGWIVYYNPRIVSRLAPYIRPQHIIRIYHTVDRLVVPPYTTNNRIDRALLSGAMSPRAYPLRCKIRDNLPRLSKVDYLKHPGYHRRGACTPDFLKKLTQYKVSICTASIYGYALRKIIESTACGCRVITDLPEDEKLPEIDGNLIRIETNTSMERLEDTIFSAIATYNPEIQSYFAEVALRRYDYRTEGKRLSNAIQTFRTIYPNPIETEEL